MLAVGDRRVGREAGGVMCSFVRKSLSHDPLPENLPVASADSNDHKLVAMRYWEYVMRARGVAVLGIQGSTVRYGGGDEDAVAPDDRRRMPLARQRDFPADVFALAPFHGRVGVWRDASAKWSTPLRPVTFTDGTIPIVTRERHRDSSQHYQQEFHHNASSSSNFCTVAST